MNCERERERTQGLPRASILQVRPGRLQTLIYPKWMLPKHRFAPILALTARSFGGMRIFRDREPCVGHAIFISYRRDDSEGEAGRLFDDLTGAFGSNGVFMDVAGISPGIDFRKAIEDNVVSCGVLLAVIGQRWISMTDAAGKRRLEDPNDFVALEIASALKRDVPVIPVLVHEAKMPPVDQLPDSLKDLAYRNSVELTHTRWNSDCQLLIEALKAYVKPTTSEPGDPVHTTVAVQLPPPRPEAAPVPAAAVKSRTPLLVGAICAVLLVAGIVLYLVARPKPVRRVIAAAPASSSTPAGAAPIGTAVSAAQNPPDALRGKWVSPTHRKHDALERVKITGSGNRLFMQAWGACKPVRCDWGKQALTLDGQDATASYAPTEPANSKIRPRTTLVRVHPDGGRLDVVIRNTFTDGASPPSNQTHRTFVPAG